MGAVPGAFDFLAFNGAFAERAAPMGACVVNGVEFITKEGALLLLDLNPSMFFHGFVAVGAHGPEMIQGRTFALAPIEYSPRIPRQELETSLARWVILAEKHGALATIASSLKERLPCSSGNAHGASASGICAA